MKLQQWIIDAEVSEGKRCLVCEKKLKPSQRNVDFEGWTFCKDHFGKYAAFIDNAKPELIFKDGFTHIEEANDWVINHINDEVLENVQEWTVIKVG